MHSPLRVLRPCPSPVGNPCAWILLGMAAVLTASCGGSPTTPTSPTPPAPLPTLISVAPASGTTAGGTATTLTGTNFTAGATVTFGGVAATGVSVDSATTIRAVAPAHGAGAVDVIVTLGTQTAMLPGGYTYVAPPPNAPPTITGITVQGTRANEPPNFADLNEEVVVTATVTDPETPIAQLAFEWSAPAGTFTGSGASVLWKAPSQAATPLSVTLTLKVTETIAAAGPGVPTASQSTTAGAVVSLHDSAREIGDIAYQFLIDFSNSNLGPEYVVRNFWDGCPGKDAELADVRENRQLFVIQSFRIGTTFPVTVDFKGTCPFRSRKADGCALVPVEWRSLRKSTGGTETATGTDQASAVFRDSRWWLCDSDFDGTVSNPLLPAFIR
ncbi:MAG: IPT/TIG domain-containing protein [Acidobacteriota bacterium]